MLRMADQSRVKPIGKLSELATVIGDQAYNLNFFVIRTDISSSFPGLLGRPWLYHAKVIVDWGKGEFTFGKLAITIPLIKLPHQGETSTADEGYTSDRSDEEGEDMSAYWIEAFAGLTEADFGFDRQVSKIGKEVEPDSDEEIYETKAINEDRLQPETPMQSNQKGIELPDPLKDEKWVGESNILLTSTWIREQLHLITIAKNVSGSGIDRPWTDFLVGQDSNESTKTVVSPAQYTQIERGKDKSCYVGRTIQDVERDVFLQLLKEYQEIFAWTTSNLTGIPKEYGEHKVALRTVTPS